MSSKVAPGVSYTLYPLEWDPTGSHASIVEWREYIKRELMKPFHEAEMQSNKHVDFHGSRLVIQARRIINKNV